MAKMVLAARCKIVHTRGDGSRKYRPIFRHQSHVQRNRSIICITDNLRAPEQVRQTRIVVRNLISESLRQ